MAPQTGDAVSEVYVKELDLSVKEKERKEKKKRSICKALTRNPSLSERFWT